MLALFPSRTVAIDLFGFEIHWYGLMYLFAFVLAIVILPNIQRTRNLHLTRDEWLSIVSWGALGVILGGRLGFVFFYEPGFFSDHPLEIVKVWNGGMSSHGGFLGVFLVLAIHCMGRKIPMRSLADVMTVPAAIGLGLGRFGNFINQELYGTPTTLPWGIAIPGMDGSYHPLQIYDMLLSFGIAAACYWHLTHRPHAFGRTFALFLILYGAMRFFLEYLRIQLYPLIDTGVLILTRGQLLTLPLLLIGVLLWKWMKPERTVVPSKSS
ncbi:MAG: phosphatidylglycerol:prolipoprotein diacylglycerol transferase [Candidatus Peregrinibacteria bacterium Greene0416_19]|nr:MAG: phosphatidylglycerol:prolipoprotein diacylglycerol transferase [Candidatus Peregrinibacteria bacterium Greene0416_19]